VVWFGESLEQKDVAAAVAATQGCDLFLVLGTSALVYPAAGFAKAAIENDTRLIEVNPESTPLSGAASLHLQEKTGVCLPAILDVCPGPVRSAES
jgi:NAD-dependent SIR2 family protein deacetylase